MLARPSFRVDALHKQDAEFKARWERVPYINCEDFGQAHSLANGNMMAANVDLMRSTQNLVLLEPLEHVMTLVVSRRFDERVPHALKFWKIWTEQCGNANDTCTHTTGYHALALARRCQ